MLGGMVKRNCSDPTDEGDFCWSDKTQALVIGAFFYGFVFQFLIVGVASRLGFTKTVRVIMLFSAAVTALYPQIAAVSPYFIVATQILRALLSGAIIGYQFEFVRKWSLPKERNYLLSIGGATAVFGMGLGSFLGGVISEGIGWEYYFYLCGLLYFLLYVVAVIFVPDTPHQCMFMSKAELGLYPTIDEGATGGSKLENTGKEYTGWGKLLRRAYLYAFCVAAFSFNTVAYNLYTTIPIYLDKVFHIPTTVLSWSTFFFGSAIGFSMMALSKVFQVVDKKLPWLPCRMIFTLVPFVNAAMIFLILPSVNYFPLIVILLVAMAMGMGTLFNGSFITVNYEIDPVNSSRMNSIFNSVGQIPGFIWPLIQVFMTETDETISDYEEVHRSRWNRYFYTMTTGPLLALAAIILAYYLRPEEWKLHPSLDATSVVVANPNVVEFDGAEEVKIKGDKGKENPAA